MSTAIRNPYVQLAKLAIERGWCWNIFCPFCSHMPFRYAFMDMAHGIMPGSEEWRMHRWPLSRDYYQNKWGRMPKTGFHHDWSLMVEDKLAALIADIDVTELLQHVPFPNLVYILGIGIYYTERAEKGKGEIGRSLASQLLQKFSMSKEGRDFLSPIARDEVRLKWEDMPKLIAALEETAGIAPAQLSGVFQFKFATTAKDFLDRHNRRRSLAEVLAMFNRQEMLRPDILAYVFLPSEAFVLARVKNCHSFSNSFITHAAYAMESNLSRREPPHLMDYLRKNGLWRPKADITLIEAQDKAGIAAAVKAVERIPVQREFVIAPADWMWSSANPNPPLEIELARP